MADFPTQFDKAPVNVPECKPNYHTPVEGFMPGQAEPLSVLLRRLTLGQAVPVVGSGVYGVDQMFESEMIDQFDVMDRSSDLRDAVSAGKQRAAEEKTSNEEPPLEPTPPA